MPNNVHALNTREWNTDKWLRWSTLLILPQFLKSVFLKKIHMLPKIFLELLSFIAQVVDLCLFKTFIFILAGSVKLCACFNLLSNILPSFSFSLDCLCLGHIIKELILSAVKLFRISFYVLPALLS